MSLIVNFGGEPITEDQTNALIYAYESLYREFREIDRMRSEPYFGARWMILDAMEKHMTVLRGVFELLGIQGEFKDLSDRRTKRPIRKED